MQRLKIVSYIFSPLVVAVIAGIVLLQRHYITAILFIVIVLSGLFVTMVNIIIIIIHLSKKG